MELSKAKKISEIVESIEKSKLQIQHLKKVKEFTTCQFSGEDGAEHKAIVQIDEYLAKKLWEIAIEAEENLLAEYEQKLKEI